MNAVGSPIICPIASSRAGAPGALASVGALAEAFSCPVLANRPTALALAQISRAHSIDLADELGRAGETDGAQLGVLDAELCAIAIEAHAPALSPEERDHAHDVAIALSLAGEGDGAQLGVADAALCAQALRGFVSAERRETVDNSRRLGSFGQPTA